jgi:hypothetical protein
MRIPNPKSPVIYTSIANAARATIRRAHGNKISVPQVEAIMKEPKMGGFLPEAIKKLNSHLDDAKAMAIPVEKYLKMHGLEKLSEAQQKSLLQEAVKNLEQKKQKIRNANWRKNHSRTRLTETIMDEAAEDFILGQGNH